MVSNSYKFTDLAKTDFDSALSYITTNLSNPKAAKDLFFAVQETIERICMFPESCPLIDNEFVKPVGVRRANISKYALFYLFDKKDSSVVILRFVYGSMNMTEILKML